METTVYSISAEPPAERNRRSDDRHLTLFRVGMLILGERRELCLVKNIPAGGALIRACSALEPEQRLEIELKEHQPVAGRVGWVRGSDAGIAFDEPVDVLELLKAAADGPRPRMPRVEVGLRLLRARRRDPSPSPCPERLPRRAKHRDSEPAVRRRQRDGHTAGTAATAGDRSMGGRPALRNHLQHGPSARRAGGMAAIAGQQLGYSPSLFIPSVAQRSIIWRSASESGCGARPGRFLMGSEGQRLAGDGMWRSSSPGKSGNSNSSPAWPQCDQATRLGTLKPWRWNSTRVSASGSSLPLHKRAFLREIAQQHGERVAGDFQRRFQHHV